MSKKGCKSFADLLHSTADASYSFASNVSRKEYLHQKEEAAHQHHFILHAALDIVQDLAWTTSAMFLKAMDRFNELVVSVYVTAGHARLMLLHDSRNEDAIKSFFQEVHELYIKCDLQLLFALLIYVSLKGVHCNQHMYQTCKYGALTCFFTCKLCTSHLNLKLSSPL
ncbi:probable trafficking protein particle complex subunit 2 [Phalaenopsis equestris]|uniref:probable trafficking protein particle complex subunit 2 n=1 Tax=Phalaenopsis equestris TaxID=78828 RepID=UPI0009E3AA23|nr:probable trafficking protein particle complex subunit 2 [Phalaenopsis equestris]